jgi:enoyl-CoA hydratase/carnithine racemase
MTNAPASELLEEWPEPGICVLRMNRPNAYNALSVELTDALRKAVASVWEKGGRVMVLAATEPGFCSGADLKQRRTMTDEQKYAHNRAINALGNEIAALPVPTVAAINGIAMGGGCELALACDIRFASESAKIGLTEARIGAMPGAGGSQRLPRLIGTARALGLIFSGEPVTGAKAMEYGLVNRLTPNEALMSAALDFARVLASRSRRTASLLKQAVYAGIEKSLSDGLELERVAIVEVLASNDYREGLTAFAEKRSPNFS